MQTLVLLALAVFGVTAREKREAEADPAILRTLYHPNEYYGHGRSLLDGTTGIHVVRTHGHGLGHDLEHHLGPGHGLGHHIGLGPGLGRQIGPGRDIEYHRRRVHGLGHHIGPTHGLGHHIGPVHGLEHHTGPAHSLGHHIVPGHGLGHHIGSSHGLGHYIGPSHGLGNPIGNGHGLRYHIGPSHGHGRYSPQHQVSVGHNLIQHPPAYTVADKSEDIHVVQHIDDGPQHQHHPEVTHDPTHRSPSFAEESSHVKVIHHDGHSHEHHAGHEVIHRTEYNAGPTHDVVKKHRIIQPIKPHIIHSHGLHPPRVHLPHVGHHHTLENSVFFNTPGHVKNIIHKSDIGTLDNGIPHDQKAYLHQNNHHYSYEVLAYHPKGGRSFVYNRRLGKREATAQSNSNMISKSDLAEMFKPGEILLSSNPPIQQRTTDSGNVVGQSTENVLSRSIGLNDLNSNIDNSHLQIDDQGISFGNKLPGRINEVIIGDTVGQVIQTHNGVLLPFNGGDTTGGQSVVPIGQHNDPIFQMFDQTHIVNGEVHISIPSSPQQSSFADLSKIGLTGHNPVQITTNFGSQPTTVHALTHPMRHHHELMPIPVTENGRTISPVMHHSMPVQNHGHHPMMQIQNHEHHPKMHIQNHGHHPMMHIQNHGHHPMTHIENHGHHPMVHIQHHTHAPVVHQGLLSAVNTGFKQTVHHKTGPPIVHAGEYIEHGIKPIPNYPHKHVAVPGLSYKKEYKVSSPSGPGHGIVAKGSYVNVPLTNPANYQGAILPAGPKVGLPAYGFGHGTVYPRIYGILPAVNPYAHGTPTAVHAIGPSIRPVIHKEVVAPKRYPSGLVAGVHYNQNVGLGSSYGTKHGLYDGFSRGKHNTMSGRSRYGIPHNPIYLEHIEELYGKPQGTAFGPDPRRKKLGRMFGPTYIHTDPYGGTHIHTNEHIHDHSTHVFEDSHETGYGTGLYVSRGLNQGGGHQKMGYEMERYSPSYGYHHGKRVGAHHGNGYGDGIHHSHGYGDGTRPSKRKIIVTKRKKVAPKTSLPYIAQSTPLPIHAGYVTTIYPVTVPYRKK